MKHGGIMNNASSNEESTSKKSEGAGKKEHSQSTDSTYYDYEVPGDSYYTQYGDDEQDMQRLIKK